MKKYPIILFEWVCKENDKKEKNTYASDLYTFILEIPLNQKNNLKDVKEFVKDECITKYDPVCLCFLLIYKQDDEDKKKNVLSIDYNYKDDTLLDDTIFNEKYKIYVCIKESRKCICGKLEHYKAQAVLLKKAEEDINELMKTHKKELENQENKFQNTIFQQGQKLYETNQKIQILEKASQKVEFKKKTKRVKKNANLRFLREKGKVIKAFYDNNSENIIYDFLEKMVKFINEKIYFEDMNVSPIGKTEKFLINIKNVFEEKIYILF